MSQVAKTDVTWPANRPAHSLHNRRYVGFHSTDRHPLPPSIFPPKLKFSYLAFLGQFDFTYTTPVACLAVPFSGMRRLLGQLTYVLARVPALTDGKCQDISMIYLKKKRSRNACVVNGTDLIWSSLDSKGDADWCDVLMI